VCEPVGREVGKPWKDRGQIPSKKPRLRSGVGHQLGLRSCRNDSVVHHYVCPGSGLRTGLIIVQSGFPGFDCVLMTG
jgi:hypothetical protein